MSNNCLNSNEERLERTATSSSVTRSGTRRENAFFFRIAIRATNISCFSQTAAVFLRIRAEKAKSAEMTQAVWSSTFKRLAAEIASRRDSRPSSHRFFNSPYGVGDEL